MATFLTVVAAFFSHAQEIFAGSGLQIREDGVRYLGGPIGTEPCVRAFAEQKVSGWCEELVSLSSIAKSSPHAAYAALTHGIMSHCTCYFRMTDFSTPNLSDILLPLEKTLQLTFIPSL